MQWRATTRRGHCEVLTLYCSVTKGMAMIVTSSAMAGSSISASAHVGSGTLYGLQGAQAGGQTGERT